MRVKRYLVLAVAVLLGGGAAASAEDSAWSGELGLAGGHNDNFFNRGPGVPAPSSDLVNIAGRLSYWTEAGRGELEFLLDGTEVLVLDIDDADYELAALTTRYKLGRTRIDLRYQLGINLLSSEEVDAAFFDIDGLRLRVRYSLSERVWLRAEGEFETWDFDPQASDRDSDITQYGISVRGALSDRVALRGILSVEDRDARAPDNSRTGTGFGLALDAQPVDDSNLFIRVRRRDREYEDAPPGENNFQRDDTLYDLNANFRWFFQRHWGAQVAVMYRDGESTRPDRNYDSSQFALGIVYRFGRVD